jgi:hypothetical protein
VGLTATAVATGLRSHILPSTPRAFASLAGAFATANNGRRFPNLQSTTAVEPTLKEILMTKTLTALLAAATLATATAAVPTTAQERCIGCGIGGVEYPIAPPGYVYYPAYYEPPPGPNCYWFRVPAYDARGNMVGWRGRPEAFCSWLSGYRRWPLR